MGGIEPVCNRMSMGAQRKELVGRKRIFVTYTLAHSYKGRVYFLLLSFKMSYFSLPPIPADLKPITPYIQRAHETRAQDPVISYWCMSDFVFAPCGLPTHLFVGAYYAAQVGISLKAVGVPNRNFLAALLTMLESLRSSVGSSDAVTVESASSAYVENFALRVFAFADNEDRRGAATRKTAKQFLAAATFFEVLNVFEDRGPWEAVSPVFSPTSFRRPIGVRSSP